MMKANMIRNNLDQTISFIEKHKQRFVKNPDKDFTRQRKLSVSDVLRFVITIEGASLKKEVYRYSNASNVNFTTSAYIQQRNKLLPSAFKTALHKFNELCSDEKTFMGYHVYAADGSYINICEDPADTDSYIKVSNDVRGHNLLELHALYDLSNHTYKDAIVLPVHKSNERVALQSMLKNNKFEEKSIIITDRGYEGYNMFAHLVNTPNVDFVCRVNQKSPIKPIKHLPMCELDEDISFEITTTQTNDDKINNRILLRQSSKKGNSPKTRISKWDFSSPYRFSLRVVRVMIAENEYETLITSLPRNIFSLETIKQLYHMRWGIETSFRTLKYTVGLTHLHSKKEEFICQEIYAKLIMYNFFERISAFAVVKHKKNKKHIYQINYVMAVAICREYYREKKSFSLITEQLQRHIEPIRPGRTGRRRLITKSFVPFVYRVSA